ncbi:hypothetical protein SAMN05421640_3602 [Ekhidna lutea]|uniref:Uncharacterized protein n=1 Tax=Ekhidna lutea TaxID=447679 RepID=A0A239M4A5_EKHLU|nr:hypothetical protein [Ekhidna lutea]SNT36953.1 hypothetical protein SAMN05421640_3602 [Ekhidna lutea]
MKTKKSIIASLWIALAILVWSCNDSSESPVDVQQENIVADNLLVNSNSALNRLRSNGIGGPMGALFGNFQSSNGGRTDQSPSAMFRNARSANDSTDTEPTCLVETWEDDGQGNYTYTLDFGDGCDYYGEWLKGKLVEKGSYSESSFSSNSTYINFGGHDWTIDGTHSYSGTWETSDETSEPSDHDSVAYHYNASYEFSADLHMAYMEYGHDSTTDVSTDEQLIEVDYVAQGAEEVDQHGYTINSRTESVDVSTGESFSSQVDIPLFYDFECEDEGVWIFVSGQQSGSYTYGDQTGTYSINFGDGSCDNIVVVTENGVSEEVDLGEEWDEWEDECGDES